MKKKILIGSILAALIMLSMPVISNIQAEPCSVTSSTKSADNDESLGFALLCVKTWHDDIGSAWPRTRLPGVKIYLDGGYRGRTLPIIAGRWLLVKAGEYNIKADPDDGCHNSQTKYDVKVYGFVTVEFTF